MRIVQMLIFKAIIFYRITVPVGALQQAYRESQSEGFTFSCLNKKTKQINPRLCGFPGLRRRDCASGTKLNSKCYRTSLFLVIFFFVKKDEALKNIFLREGEDNQDRTRTNGINITDITKFTLHACDTLLNRHG